MVRSIRTWVLALAAALILGAALATAQEGPDPEIPPRVPGPRPTHVPIGDDVAADQEHLLERWAELQARLSAREKLKELYEKLRKDPQLLNRDPDTEQKLKDLIRRSGALDDPRIKDQLEKWLKNRTKFGDTLKQLTPEEQAQLQARMQKLLEELKKGGPTDIPPDLVKPPDATTNPPAPVDEEELDARRRFTDWLIEQSRRLDDGRFQNSDLARQIRNDLGRFAANPALRDTQRWGVDGKLGKRLTDFTRDLRTSRLWSELKFPMPQFKFPTGSLPGLPKFGSWGRPPALGGSLPGLGAPTLSMPSAQAPSFDLLLWIVMLAAGGFLGWRLLRLYRPATNTSVGRYPQIELQTLTPNGLANRADLIRAFEHLSLATLGTESRTWNHLELAAGLGGTTAERQQAAGTLALLYEQARYAPQGDPLSSDSLTAARRSLTVLAEGGAS